MTIDDRPVVLDLFCCAGGAARGYRQAGFRVHGVDNVRRPRYCGDQFSLDDAAYRLEVMHALGQLEGYALIHLSCPCQWDSALNAGTNGDRDHPDLIPIMRPLVEATGLPSVWEQPAGRATKTGKIRKDLMLCMDMHEMQRPAEPPWVQRHRWFELNGFTAPQPKHVPHQGRVRGMRHGEVFDGPYVAAYGDGGGKATVPEMQHAMGIDWTDVREELTEAIPPAYTRYIGEAFLAGRTIN